MNCNLDKRRNDLKNGEYYNSLIRRKATGNQKEFSRKVGLSRSALNEYLKEMKQLGFPICYCKKRKCYYYENEGSMVKTFYQNSLSQEEAYNINGGSKMIFDSYIIDYYNELDHVEV